MATYPTLSALFTAIADAIRAKTGVTGKIVADNFPAEIANIETASPGLKVNSITTSGTYDSANYHGDYWAAIDSNGNLLLAVIGGTSSNYESIYFTAASLPSGASLLQQSYYGGTSMTVSMAYVGIFTGLTSDVDIKLDFNAANSSYDYITCAVTITAA